MLPITNQEVIYSRHCQWFYKPHVFEILQIILLYLGNFLLLAVCSFIYSSLIYGNLFICKRLSVFLYLKICFVFVWLFVRESENKREGDQDLVREKNQLRIYCMIFSIKFIKILQERKQAIILIVKLYSVLFPFRVILNQFKLLTI